jgi:hypothetical protein
MLGGSSAPPGPSRLPRAHAQPSFLVNRPTVAAPSPTSMLVRNHSQSAMASNYGPVDEEGNAYAGPPAEGPPAQRRFMTLLDSKVRPCQVVGL